MSAMWVYWLIAFPCARRELHRLQLQAEAIPDVALRRIAIEKLRSQRLVTEGGAAFATLAMACHRSDVVRACVTYEVMYDFLDAVGEQEAAEPLTHNRRLHRALTAALTPGMPVENYYDDAHDDGGYLHGLIETCRDALARLPAHRDVLPALQRFSARAGEAQSLNHAGMHDGHGALARWTVTQRSDHASIHWWEIAAAASDPLGIYALIAVASDADTKADHVAAIERAYFPWVGALVWLLESLVDQREDAITGNHNYIQRYPSQEAAARRLAALAQCAATALRRLPNGDRHAVLLAGVVGMYLSHEEAVAPEALTAAEAVRRAVGGPVTPLLAVLRLRRHLAGERPRRLRGGAGAGG